MIGPQELCKTNSFGSKSRFHFFDNNKYMYVMPLFLFFISEILEHMIF